MDSYHIGIPFMEGIITGMFPNFPQQSSALRSNLVRSRFGKCVGNHEPAFLFRMIGILLENIEIIAEVFHPLPCKVIDFRFILVNDQLHIFRQVLGHTVTKTFCILQIFAQYQNIICISYMNPDFQLGFFQSPPSVSWVMEFLHGRVMPAVPLVTKPDIKPMQIDITD